MPDWTDAEEFRGRRAFDVWRFLEAEQPVAWDWADMADPERQCWIDRAKRPTEAA